MRRKLYSLLNCTPYSVFMVLCIISSVIPLAFKRHHSSFVAVEAVTTCIFIFDYAVRWITADLEQPKKSNAFITYPFHPMSVIDLVSILPSVTTLSSGFRLLKIFRLFRTLRIIRALRVFKAFRLARYSRSVKMIGNVFKAQIESLMTVLFLALAYILISALVVFNVEPKTFDDFFEAIYWATISLTTMGYGDIYPVTVIGRIVTIISSLFGIAIVALPAGIVTAGYLDELKKEHERNAKRKNAPFQSLAAGTVPQKSRTEKTKKKSRTKRKESVL